MWNGKVKWKSCFHWAGTKRWHIGDTYLLPMHNLPGTIPQHCGWWYQRAEEEVDEKKQQKSFFKDTLKPLNDKQEFLIPWHSFLLTTLSALWRFCIKKKNIINHTAVFLLTYTYVINCVFPSTHKIKHLIKMSCYSSRKDGGLCYPGNRDPSGGKSQVPELTFAL